MSTRSLLCVEEKSGEIVAGCYCHSDGYVSHQRPKLLKYWTELKEVLELVSNGGMRFLADSIKNTQYYNDKKKMKEVFGDNHDRSSEVVPIRAPSREVLVKDEAGDLFDIEYFYVFNIETCEWWVQGGSCNEFVRLTEASLQEWEKEDIAA